ncbi:hypothetical protein TARUN_10482, partial [Trichoderma arundinaceum]
MVGPSLIGLIAPQPFSKGRQGGEDQLHYFMPRRCSTLCLDTSAELARGVRSSSNNKYPYPSDAIGLSNRRLTDDAAARPLVANSFAAYIGA